MFVQGEKKLATGLNLTQHYMISIWPSSTDHCALCVCVCLHSEDLPQCEVHLQYVTGPLSSLALTHQTLQRLRNGSTHSHTHTHTLTHTHTHTHAHTLTHTHTHTHTRTRTQRLTAGSGNLAPHSLPRSSFPQPFIGPHTGQFEAR